MHDGHNVVVTMTSWKGRIATVGQVISQFIEHQTIKPDAFFLWLSTEEFPNRELDLPIGLLQVVENLGIQIRWLETNEYCCKRWHVFPEHYDDYVLSIDDDSMHSPQLVEDCIAELDHMKALGHQKCACNVWWQFSAVPTYSDDIKIKFQYSKEVPSQKIWTCATCMYAPQSFPLEALNPEVLKFRNENLPKNDEAWLIPYVLKSGIQMSFVHRSFPYMPIENEAETSLCKFNGKTLDSFGYSNTEKALYRMLKFSGMLESYKFIHPGYSEERFEACQIT